MARRKKPPTKAKDDEWLSRVPVGGPIPGHPEDDHNLPLILTGPCANSEALRRLKAQAQAQPKLMRKGTG